MYLPSGRMHTQQAPLERKLTIVSNIFRVLRRAGGEDRGGGPQPAVDESDYLLRRARRPICPGLFNAHIALPSVTS
jgi:hypothetical protein